MSADVKGPWEFDKSLKYPSRRRGGPLFSSDLGDLEKIQRMKKREEVAAILDASPRRKPVAAAVEHPPEKILQRVAQSPSMVDALAQAKFERAAAKLAHAEDPEPDGSPTMTEQLAAARRKAGKS